MSLEEQIKDAESSLSEQIGETNNRVKILEASNDKMSGLGVADKFDDMEIRIKDLEGFKRETGGMAKATVSIVRDAAMILTLFLAAWRMVGDQALHSSLIDQNHQHPAAGAQQLKDIK